MTHRSPKAPAEQNRTAVLASALARGVVAAGLGLGALAVLGTVLWISSPFPDGGPDGALRAAAGIWLLAHGAGLVRTGALAGGPAPVAMVPLLLVVGPVWLAHRAARGAAVAEAGRARPSPARAFCAVTAGYLLVMAGAAAYARGGSLRVEPDALAFPAALVVAGAAAAGVWSAAGRPLGPMPSWSPLALQEAVARTLFRDRAEAVCRSAAAGVMVLLGGGALLVAVALGRNAEAAQDSFLALAGDWSGRCAVLLLAVSLVPNAALWGASYGLGPGFSLGTGATATLLGLDGAPAAPEFPLLAALPAQGPGSALNGAALAVPAAAALAVAWFTVRRAAPVGVPRARAWSPRETVLVTLSAAAGCGAGTALLTAVAGGPLGTGVLSAFGPVWWLTGPAAMAWTGFVGVPAALLLRAWRLREPGWTAWRGSVPEASSATTAEQRDAPAPARRAGGGQQAVGAPEAPEAPEGSGKPGCPEKSALPEKPEASEAPESSESAAGGEKVPVQRSRRWWAPWRTGSGVGKGGDRGTAVPGGSAATSVPAPGAALSPAGDGRNGGGFEPYDFLPADPWHEKESRGAGGDGPPSGGAPAG
ncbi:DUF6350 family protein [Streptomyces pratensis]|uniref:cell division protein PerM n=1 Tax=Streptomyces pratensis TaxID=1169025 RepID=UPI0030163C8F